MSLDSDVAEQSRSHQTAEPVHAALKACLDRGCMVPWAEKPAVCFLCQGQPVRVFSSEPAVRAVLRDRFDCHSASNKVLAGTIDLQVHRDPAAGLDLVLRSGDIVAGAIRSPSGDLAYASFDRAAGNWSAGDIRAPRGGVADWTDDDALFAFLELHIVQRIAQRIPGVMCLHGGSVTDGARGLLVLGESCAGKTTMALALSALGLEVLNDDVSPLRLADAAALRHGRALRVRAGSFALLEGIVPEAALRALRPGARGATRPSSSSSSSSSSARTQIQGPITDVIHLTGYGPEPHLARLSARAGFDILVRNTVIRPAGAPGLLAMNIARFLSGVAVWRLQAGHPAETLALLRDRLDLGALQRPPQKTGIGDMTC